MLNIFVFNANPYPMEVKQAYRFGDAQTANRFLNDVRSGTVAGVLAKFHRNNSTVLLQFSMEDSEGGFDSRSADLDDLARQYEGTEVT